MTPPDDARAQVISRIAELVSRTESIADPSARATAINLLQAVMELHAGAFDRVLEIVTANGATEVLSALTDDDLVSSVMVLHGLHPDDTETRLRRAVDKLKRYFDVRGAGITLVSVDSTSVHLRFQGSRLGAAAAARQTIEDAIYGAAPELERLVVDGLEEKPAAGFVPVSALLAVQKA